MQLSSYQTPTAAKLAALHSLNTARRAKQTEAPFKNLFGETRWVRSSSPSLWPSILSHPTSSPLTRWIE